MTKLVNKGGRPLLWKDPEAMAARIEEYFTHCDNRLVQGYDAKNNTQFAYISPEPYTLAGLAYELGMDRQSLLAYGTRSKYLGLIKRARERIAIDIERRLLEGKNTIGAIFYLKNNYGYVDKTEVDTNTTGSLTVNIDAIIGLNKPAPLKVVQSISAPDIKTLPIKSKKSKRMTGKQAKQANVSHRA